MNKTPVIWKTARQTTTATSTVEAEFVAVSSAIKDVLWLRNLLNELNFKLQPTRVRVDNQGAIRLIQNNQVHSKTKHLDIKLHFIRDVCGKDLFIEYVSTKENLADMLTKNLPSKRFNEICHQLKLLGKQEEEINIAEADSDQEEGGKSKLVINKPDKLNSVDSARPKSAIRMAMILMLLSLQTIAKVDSTQFLYKEEVTTKEVILYLTSPCWDIRKLYPYKPFETAATTYFREHTFDLCDKSYKEILLESVKEFDNCDFTRSKRDLLEKIIDGTIYVASNLIDSYVVSNKKETRDGAVEEFYSKFDLARTFHEDTPGYLVLASEASKAHPSEWVEMASRYPGVIWIINRAHSEILANAANFKALAAKCRSGKVAVLELAELLKMPELKEIDEELTRLISVTSSDWSEKVIFRFKVVKLLIDWEVVTRIGLILCCLTLVVYVSRNKLIQLAKRARKLSSVKNESLKEKNIATKSEAKVTLRFEEEC